LPFLDTRPDFLAAGVFDLEEILDFLFDFLPGVLGVIKLLLALDIWVVWLFVIFPLWLKLGKAEILPEEI
jgi:hypothetical protein